MDFGRFGEPTWEGKSTQDRSKIDPKGHQKNDREKRASWKRLGGVLGFQNPSEPAGGGWRRLDAGAVAETQRPLLRIPEDFLWILLCISVVYPKIKEVKKD